jgi:hypothetical protein
MKTMIPNVVRLGLDFSDLPARATQVSPEELALSGGRSCQNAGGQPIFNQSQAGTVCRRVCSSIGTVWNGQWSTVSQGRASVCGCCKR